uniref:Putative group ix salivary lipocalin n=1 Tax=Rhipicephalus pulchellus TaxID=72859 RepID=L7M9U6_RHIPC
MRSMGFLRRPLLILSILVHCKCQSGDDSETGDTSVKAIYVKKLLNGTDPLIVFLGNEGEINHPICWQSMKTDNIERGFRHNLTYFRKDKQCRKKHGSWQVRNTTYRVSRRKQVPTTGVTALMANGATDEDISRVYDIFYAQPFCFVMGTPQNESAGFTMGSNGLRISPDDSRCLLWGPVNIQRETRIVCEEEFFNLCNNVGIYPYRYRKRVCDTEEEE